MDQAIDPADEAQVRDLISANAEGAIEVHDLKTRLAGRAMFIEFHLVVPEAMTVGDAHDICDRIEDALQASFEGARVLDPRRARRPRPSRPACRCSECGAGAGAGRPSPPALRCRRTTAGGCLYS